MDGTSSTAVASWIDKLNGTVIPIKPKTALREVVLQRDINGRAFSMVLNEHALTDFNVPDLTLAMSTKVRKCWHADFPASVGIKPQGSVRGEDQGARYDPTQDGADYSGYEGYAGYKTGPSTGKASRNSGGRGAGDSVRSGYPSVSASQSLPKRNDKRMVTITLENMRAALDCVADRADLNRQEMFLWVRDVIPDEVWTPLWEEYTSDLIRQQHNDVRSSKSLSSPKQIQSPGRAPAYNPPSQARSTPSPEMRRAPSPERPSFPGHQTYSQMGDEYPCQDDDELSALPELRSRLDRRHNGPGPAARGPGLERTMSPKRDDDMVSQAETLRSEAESMASEAISHWLDDGKVGGAKLSPFELANWLRTLPRDRLDGDMLKTLAKYVLDKEMDENDVAEAVATGGFTSLGVADQRQAQILEKYFKQRQSEAALAQAAKQSGALNRQFNAKLEAKSKTWEA